MTTPPPLEAKIVILGSQGVGKTSLVHRYIRNTFTPSTAVSTVGASFLTKRLLDADTGTVVRLQIWDTAGQERFRSISKLYYRGADAGVLCYDITDAASFGEMGRWMEELRRNLGDEVVLHVVGTKADVVAQEPGRRGVPFERCIAYAAEHLYPGAGKEAMAVSANGSAGAGGAAAAGGMTSPPSNRSSGFWAQDLGWDCCHEISAKDGEGVEEVFRVITRKLVERRNRRLEAEARKLATAGKTPGVEGRGTGYFDYATGQGNGSFRVGHGDKRRSWLGFPTTPGPGSAEGTEEEWREVERLREEGRGRCC